MSKLVKKLLFSVIILLSFYVAGYFAMFLEHWHDSVIASSAIFGVSFAGLVGGGVKLIHDIFV